MNFANPPRAAAIRTLVSLSVLLCASSAQAQAVRKCTVDGRIVFQSSPCALEARVAAAAPPAAVVEAPKKKTLTDLLRERDGNDLKRPAGREFERDGANVLRSRMGAV